MDGEELRELQQQVRENNKILKGLQRHNRMATFASILKFVIYIAILIGSYYYIQPYINKAFEAYEGIKETSESISGIKAKANTSLDELIEKFKPHDGQ